MQPQKELTLRKKAVEREILKELEKKKMENDIQEMLGSCGKRN